MRSLSISIKMHTILTGLSHSRTLCCCLSTNWLVSGLRERNRQQEQQREGPQICHIFEARKIINNCPLESTSQYKGQTWIYNRQQLQQFILMKGPNRQSQDLSCINQNVSVSRFNQHHPFMSKLAGKASNMQLKKSTQPDNSQSPLRPQRKFSGGFEELPQDISARQQLNKLFDYKPLMSEKLCNETEQWTERMLKRTYIQDKHKSCSNIVPEDEEDLHLRKYTQLFSLSPHVYPKMSAIQKKLKEFRFLKENDHNSAASTIAKMKCFCLDNSQSVFDFYRCTDLLQLKYMIFLLIQEVNQRSIDTLPQPECSQCKTGQQQLKQIVKEVVATIYEIIAEFKNKPTDRTCRAVDQLNRQIQHIQSKFNILDDRGLPHSRLFSVNLDNCSTPQGQMRKVNFFNANTASQPRSKDIEFQTSPKQSQAKVIQFQIDELNVKNQTIKKLSDQLGKLQLQKKQFIEQIAELSQNLQTISNNIKKKEAKIEELEGVKDKLEESMKVFKQERDTYFNTYIQHKDEYVQLKKLYDDLQRNNLTMHKEYSKLKQTLTDQYHSEVAQMRASRDDENASLRKALNEKQLIIGTILDDAFFFGKQLKAVTDQMLSIGTEQLPRDLLQLQRDLYLQETTMNQKLNTIQQFQLNHQMLNESALQLENDQSQISTSLNKSQPFFIGQSRKSSQYALDQVNFQKQHADMMHMLLAQCDVIEKFLL